MRRDDKKKLTLKRRTIVNHLLDLEGVLDHLIAKQVFTPAIRERIIYESRVPRDRVRHTLDLLITRGPNAFKFFIEALVLTGNVHIAHELDSEYVDSEECRNLIESETKYSVEATNIYHHYCQQQQHQQQQQQHYFLSPKNYIINKSSSVLSPCTIKVGDQDTAEILSKSTMSPRQPHQTLINLRHKSPSPAALMRSSNITNEMSPQYRQNQVLSPLSVISQTKYPITVASCQFSSNNSPNTSNEINRSNGVLFSQPKQSINYSNDDTLLILNQDSLLPQDINWDDINNLDLDFDVLTNNNNDDFTDESRNYQRNFEECYSMENEPRGVCLIINNEHFFDNEHNEIENMRRYGTDMDATRLKALFEKLNFEVKFQYDLSEKELRQSIQKFARDCDENSNNYDAICLIILSHGTDGYIYGTDFENKINLDKDVLNLFDHVLHNKPKLFIFQACRGENFNQKLTYCGVEETMRKFEDLKVNQTTVIKHQRSESPSTITNTSTPSTSASLNNLKNLNKTPNKFSNFHKAASFTDFIDGRPIRTTLPSRSDFFIWYSSVRGFVSHRDSDGSPFIKCLVAVFSRYSKDLELIEMVRKVNLLMQQYEKKHFDEQNSVSSYFMLPVPEYHLTKKFYFNP